MTRVSVPNPPLLPWVRACDIVHGLPGDHLGVELVLAPPVMLPCGKGRWRLPLHLLQDQQYCKGVILCPVLVLAAVG